ncbi:MAG: L-cysteine:1D-myo-inositol 2-amino-2-deoxy-alpha-D-glucopyranoside ligase, partial [Pseudonocardiales bacterium]|nr:L-cysteine:1D-myo-inositol 2-amino-2-deoxy-alpha-D-glucopyranoside ligase [Pseudonocardiales bacterium]
SLPAARSLTLGGQALPLISPARVYLCGITPYDVTHLGHAATFVWADAAGPPELPVRAYRLLCVGIRNSAAAHRLHPARAGLPLPNRR